MSKGVKSGIFGNWLSKLLSLGIAIAIWFTVFSHIDKTKKRKTPVPGTTEQIPIPETDSPPALIPTQPIIPGN